MHEQLGHPVSPKEYIKKIGLVDYIQTALVTGHGSKSSPHSGGTLPLVVELAEPMTELILTLQQPEAPRVSAIDEGNGKYYVSKEEDCPSTKAEGNRHRCSCCFRIF